MKSLVIICFLFLNCFAIKAQQTLFCNGFEEGFKNGKKHLNEHNYIVPICPIVSSRQNTYDYGYSVGYGKATGKDVLLVPETNNATFENGFKKGFEFVMTQNKKTNYIIPITPIAPVNGDDYETGYLQGVNKAHEKLKISNTNNTIVLENNDNEKTFCDSWEDGYKMGLKEWATTNRRSIPLKITPICPIAKINQASYQNGFELGLQKAKKDLEK